MAVDGIKKVGICGCGLMGSGIVEVCARSGYDVVVREVTQKFLDGGIARIEASLDKGVKRGKLEQKDRDAARERIKGTTSVDDLADCDIVIEAIIENVEAKKDVFRALDGVVRDDVVLCSNTSSISITEMATVTRRPDQFLGVHFMNPVPVMPLVEMIRGLQTSDATYERANAFVESLGKTTIVAKDTPGFAINVILIPYLCEAIRTYELGVASTEDIDKGMKLGCNMPMGPFELADFVGLDTTLHVADVLYEEFGDAKYAAPVLLRRMVQAGWMGRKSGKGFYDYGGGAK